MHAIDPVEIRAVTANYFFWQGLRWIPLGIVLVLVASFDHPALAATLTGSRWVLWPLTLIALGISNRTLGSYYRRRFGSVDADPELHTRRSAIKWLVVYPAMALSMAVDLKLASPILVSGPVWGAAIELYRRSTGGGRSHYSAAATSLAIFGALPLFGVIPTGRHGVSALVAFVGLIYVIGGILDHRALVRVLTGASR